MQNQATQMSPWVTICITVAAAAAGLLLLLRWKATASSRRGRLPPGPQGWPLFGNIFDLGTLPHVSLAKMSRKYGPLVWIRLGAVNTLVISSAEAAAELFKNHDHTFCNRHLIQAFRSDEAMSSIVSLSDYGPFWRAMRRLYATEIFSRKRIQDTVDLRRKCVEKMVDWITYEANGTGIEVVPFVLATSFNLIGNLVLSRDLVDPKSTRGNEFFHLSAELTELVIKPNLADFFPALRWLDPQGIKKKVKRKLDLILEIISRFVEERRADNKRDTLDKQQGSDFLDVLLAFEGNGKDEPDKIPDRLLQMLILELLTAGTENIVVTTEWAMAELLRNPGAMKTVQAEILQVVGRDRKIEESDMENLHYLRAVIKETLRLHSSPFLVPRSVVKDTEFMGYLVPKDTQVFVGAWALGRDTNNWDDPLSFKPERFLGSQLDYRGQHFELLPFGAGRRICPGIILAEKMIHLVLGSLLQNFEWVLENGDTPESLDMGEKLESVIKKAIPLKAIPRPFIV